MTLEELKRLEAEATPAPWDHYDNGFDAGIVQAGKKQGPYPSFVFGGEPHEGRVEAEDPDAKLTIAARNILPKLIAVAEAAKYAAEEAFWLDDSTMIPTLEGTAREKIRAALKDLESDK